MTKTTCENTELEAQIADIASCLEEIREDISRILRCIQDELEAFRVRQFWQEYGDSYQQE